MSHPMSEFSERSRGRLLTAGIPHTPEPFAPENLPRIQYEMHGETTVDQRATEMLRKPTEAEIKQLGDPFRSDLNPHNYRTHSLYISDAEIVDGQIIEVQTDFQVWALMYWVVPIINPGGATTFPTNHLAILPENTAFFGNLWINFPIGRQLKLQALVGAAGVVGAGFQIYLFDRWIPDMTGTWG